MFKMIGSAAPRYLAATDLLIGDMSNINYEFLLFDRPIVLLANEWIKRNFPEIGPKTDLNNLKTIVEMSLKNPNDYKSSRKFWLEKTITIKKNSASERYIDLILQKSKIRAPEFIFVTGNNNAVKKTNLEPLIEEVNRRSFKYSVVIRKSEVVCKNYNSAIIIAAHFIDIPPSIPGYKVHIDHDLKGVASANLEYAIWDYKRHNYFPYIDLHIVAGEAGEKRTKLVLGPYADRTVVGGYPKGDHLVKLNTKENKNRVYDELGFQKKIPLVTYAPAGESNFMKPGGSLNKDVISKLKEISAEGEFHVLIKIKYSQSMKNRLKHLLKAMNIFKKKIYDDGSKWRALFNG